MNPNRRRRLAGTLIVLGLLLMVVTAVALAEEPTSTPAPVPTVTPAPEPVLTPTPTPEPVLTATATPVLTPTATAEPSPTATATPTPTPEVTATATASPTASPTAEPERPQRGELQQAPTPTATAAPTGALMTICSYTGDADQPYVSVVIPADQYSPYFDEETAIIPAPPYGCENITDPDEAAREPTTLCHATGNPDRPYVLVQLPNGDFGGHETHVGDIIPAPQKTCPEAAGYVVPTATPTATATATAEPTRTAIPTVTPEPTVIKEVLPDDEAGDDGDNKPIAEVLDDLAGAAAPTQTSASSLPFTGADVWVLFAWGVALVMMGAGLRLMGRYPPVGVTR
jgi:hypothetical protein